MNDEVKIIKADYDDLEEILNLQKIAFVTEAELYNNYDIEPLKQSLEDIRKDYADYLFIKAMINSQIVGAVRGRAEESSCWIGKLFVDPAYRGNGIGRKLLQWVENLFPQVNSFYLFTGSKSIANIKLYESVGYSRYGEFTDKKNTGVVLIKMVKNKR